MPLTFSAAFAGRGWDGLGIRNENTSDDELIMETRRLKIYFETPSEIRNKSQRRPMSSKNALNRADEL